MPSSSSAIYRRAYSNALGEGAFEAFKSLNLTDAQFRGNIEKELGLRAGQRFEDAETGIGLRIVRARGAAMAVGQVLHLFSGAAGRLGNLTGASTKSILTTDDDFTTGTGLSQLADGIVSITTGTAEGQARYIRDNSIGANSTITVVEGKDNSFLGTQTSDDHPDAFDNLPDATSDYEVLCPWEYTPCVAATNCVRAVALGTVTENNWTIVQDRGPAMVLVDGTVDVIIGDWLIPTTTPGVAAKLVVTNLEPTIAQMESIAAAFAKIIGGYVDNSAKIRLVQLALRNF